MNIEAYCFAVDQNNMVIKQGWFVDFVTKDVHKSPQRFVLFKTELTSDNSQQEYYIFPMESVFFRNIGD